MFFLCFFVNDPAATENYTYLHPLSLHDARPIFHGLVPFKPDEKALEKASLERLLGTMKMINGNHALQKQLASLLDKRNDIAHRMLLPHFGVRRRDEDLRRVHDELKSTEESLHGAMKDLAREIVTIKIGRANI